MLYNWKKYLLIIILILSCYNEWEEDYPELTFIEGPMMIDIDFGFAEGVRFKGLVKNVGTAPTEGHCFVAFKLYNSSLDFFTTENVELENTPLTPGETTYLIDNQYYYEDTKIDSFSYYFSN